MFSEARALGVRRLALSRDGRRVALTGLALWLDDRDRRVATRARATTVAGQWVNDATWGPGDGFDKLTARVQIEGTAHLLPK